jgi:hypothetical protein
MEENYWLSTPKCLVMHNSPVSNNRTHLKTSARWVFVLPYHITMSPISEKRAVAVQLKKSYSFCCLVHNLQN